METLLFLVCSQLGCNVVLLLVANLIGMYHKYLTDVTHRHTFLEARKSIKSMVELEQEKKEQVGHVTLFSSLLSDLTCKSWDFKHSSLIFYFF